jgi:PAS domain S-box-containing protein
MPSNPPVPPPGTDATLHELHQRLELLAEHVPGVLYQFCLRADGTSCFPYSSAGMRDVYGVTPEEVREDATAVFNVLHPDDRERVTAGILRSAESLTRWRDEYRCVHPDGRTLWLEGESTPRRLPDGSVLWHGYIRDATERKAAEAEREEQRRIEQLASDLAAQFVAVSPDPAAVSDAIRDALARIADATGLDVCSVWEVPADRPDVIEVVCMHRRDDGPVLPPGTDGTHARPWTRARLLETRRTLVIEDTTAMPDEAAVDRAGHAALGVRSGVNVPFFGPDGSWVGVFAGGTTHLSPPTPTVVGRIELFAHLIFDLLIRTHSDRALALSVKERERLQAQIVQAQKLEAIGRLAGGVAHDFNNMLGAIIGYAELALEKVPAEAPLRADLLEILTAANRTKGVTRQLLTFARKQVVSPEVVDVNTTVEGMLRMLQRLIGENIRLEWRPGSVQWPVRIDPSQVDQILANLCVNARDAITDTGTVTVSTREVTITEADLAQHPEAAPGGYVALVVQDDGSGMTPDMLAHIFEPFFTTKPTGQGTGLGLPTVYGIVTQSQGFISIETAPGRGTTFTVHLPRYLGTVTPEQDEGVAVAMPGRGETVLVVEDERAILALVTRVLETAGYRVLPASDPDTALTIARAHPEAIDLLLTDMVMPGMNGRTLAEAVHAIRPSIRCVFMSGYAPDELQKETSGGVRCRYLQKPFTREELTVRVRETLDAVR